MDITLDKKSAVEASIKITLFEEDYQEKVTEKIKDIAKKANINGFRPGKVPVGIIKKKHGKGILIDEINTLLDAALKDYINEQDLNIIGGPIPSESRESDINFDSQKDFEFDFDIGLRDDFEVDISKEIKMDRYSIKVEQESINGWVAYEKKVYGKTDLAEISEAGDGFYGTLETINEGFSGNVFINTEEVSKIQLEKFIGRKVDDVIEFEFDDLFEDDFYFEKFLEQIDDKDLDYLTGASTFTVLEIEHTTPAPFEQEFFDDVFGEGTVSNEEEFMSKAEEVLSLRYALLSDMLISKNIRDYLMENTKIEIPDNFLRRWLVLDSEGKLTEEVVDREYDKYEKGVKWNLIKKKIADKYGIKVEEEEIMESARDYMANVYSDETGTYLDEDTLDEYTRDYLEHNNDEKYKEIFSDLLRSKIIKAFEDNITLVDKEISYDEFRKLEMSL